MLRSNYRRAFASARAVFTGSVVACGLCVATKAAAITPAPLPALIQPSEEEPELDSHRIFALGMIETGNDDRAVGAAGEVSRYQLKPPVWKTYSSSMEYRNPAVSVQVARQHWNHLAACFKEKTGRTADDFDMYVLWNTGYAYYAHKNFSHHLIAAIVRDRAQRFVNLVNRRD